MSTAAIASKDASADARVGRVDMKLEVITIPVSDLDRAKEFYVGLGWRLDADFRNGGARVLQFTPPGSQSSIHFGTNLTSAAPGSAQRVYLVVSDSQAAREDLVRRGVDVSEVFHYAAGPAPFGGRVSGIAPDHLTPVAAVSPSWLCIRSTARRGS
jgi:catechol 2,3-dioxygenase-like lactoylglutathione lyase family enzyme